MTDVTRLMASARSSCRSTTVLVHADGMTPVFLYLAWPLGSSTTYTLHQYRSFVRDPEGAYSNELQARFDPDAVLPADASATGFNRGKWELWTNPSDQESVYLVSDERVERWPRDHEEKGCS